jgi:Zn-dependent protease
MDADFITGLILRLPVILFSLTVHEFMHAWAAWKCGDDTARRAGRLTLNPLAHLDLLGTICLIVGPIGWAKPVPVDRSNFRYETARRDDILVSGAGVAANFVLGIVFALVLRFFGGAILAIDQVGPILYEMVFVGGLINFGLAIFNLLPIPPLDGSHILQNLLPLNAAIRFQELRSYGAIVLLVFVLGNRYLSAAVGFSILGYPVYTLMGLFGGSQVI